MITFTQQQKLDAYRKASPPKQDAAFSEAIGSVIADVARKYRLTPEQGKSLQYLIGASIVDLLPRDAMLQNIEDASMRQDVLTTVIPVIDRVIRDYKPEPPEAEESDLALPSKPVPPPTPLTKIVPQMTKQTVLRDLHATPPTPPSPAAAPMTKPIAQAPTNLPTQQNPTLTPVSTSTAPEEASIKLPTMFVPGQDVSKTETFDRVAFLREIEEPQVSVPIPPKAAPVPPPSNPVDQKLQSVVFTPREEKKVILETPKTPSVSMPSTKIPPSYSAKDPYRELPE